MTDERCPKCGVLMLIDNRRLQHFCADAIESSGGTLAAKRPRAGALFEHFVNAGRAQKHPNMRSEKVFDRYLSDEEVETERQRAIGEVYAMSSGRTVNIGSADRWEARWSELYALAFAALAPQFRFPPFEPAPPEDQPDPPAARHAERMIAQRRAAAQHLAEQAAVLANEALRVEMRRAAERAP